MLDLGLSMPKDCPGQLSVDPSDIVHSAASSRRILQGVNYHAGTSVNDELQQGSEAWGEDALASLAVRLQELDITDPWFEYADHSPACHNADEDDKTEQARGYNKDDEAAEAWSSNETHYGAAEEYRDDEPSQNSIEDATDQLFHVVDEAVKTDDLVVSDPWFGHSSQPDYKYHGDPSALPAESSETKSRSSLDLPATHRPSDVDMDERSPEGGHQRPVLRIEHRITFRLPELKLSVQKLARQFLFIYWALTFPFVLIIVWQAFFSYGDIYCRPVVFL